MLCRRGSSTIHNERLWAQRSARCTGSPVKAATVGSTLGRDRAKGLLTCLNTRADSSMPCFAFVCTASTKIFEHAKNPCPPFDQTKGSNSRWHGNARIPHNSIRKIKMTIVSPVKGLENIDCFPTFSFVFMGLG